MLAKETLIAKIREMASAINAPESTLPAVGEWNDFANPYVMIDDGAYHYLVRERGETLQDRKTHDLNELLYWIFQDVTFNMAVQFETKHRVANQDFRRMLFDHQLQLLGTLHPSWRRTREQEIAAILEQSPPRLTCSYKIAPACG